MRRQLSRWGVATAAAVIAIALVPAGASEGASRTTASTAPKDGRIVAANLDTGRLETLNPDGSARQVVTPDGEHAFQPVWSPDASRIAFSSDHAGPDPRIYTIKADGTGMQQVIHDPDGYVDNTPTYTPDGKRIVFTRCRPDPPGGCALYSIRPDGTGLHAVTAYDDPDKADFYPDVSPDGARVAFTRFNDHGILCRTWVANIDGSHAHAISAPKLEAGAPAWAPDGRHLFVTLDFSHFGNNIARMRDDGTQVTRLTSARFPHNSLFASVSPSGSRVVYSDDQAYPQLIGSDLIVMKPDGSGKHAIATHTRLFDPDWGTAPLIKTSAAQLRADSLPSTTARRAVAPGWATPGHVQASASTRRWTR